MNVITSYPIIVDGNVTSTYSNANGRRRRRTRTRDGVGSLVGSGKVKGFLEKVGGTSTGLAGLLGGATAPRDSESMLPPPPPPTPERKGLSMGAKIGIGVGVIAVLGIGVYLATKKK